MCVLYDVSALLLVSMSSFSTYHLKEISMLMTSFVNECMMTGML